MKKLLLILSLCSSLCHGVMAQQEDYEIDPLFARGPAVRPVTSVITMGTGRTKMRDTYLTPLLYQGPGVDLRYERSRLMRLCLWSNMQTVDLSYMKGDDQGAGLSSSRAGRLRYHYAMHKVFRLGVEDMATAETPFTVMVGPYAGFETGFDYNLKMASGNNPATARLSLNLGLSAAATWRYQLRQQPCNVQLAMQMPLMGRAWVPQYGISYYEAFGLPDSQSMGDAFHFTSFHNQQDLDLRLTTDVPLAVIPFLKGLDTTLRVGFAYHIETMDINDIVTRYSTCQVVVGWTYQYLPFSRRKAKSLNIRSAYAY